MSNKPTKVTKPLTVEPGILRLPNGKFRARIVRLDGSGKPFQRTREGDNISEARRHKKALEDEFKQGGIPAIDASKMKFRQLAEIYKDKKLIPAEYDDPESDDRVKLKGLKTWKSSQAFLDTATLYLGNLPVKNIKDEDIEEFKHLRLKEPKERGGGRRKVASVQRELEVLRAVFRYAVGKKFINRSPFNGDIQLITKDDETERDRVLEFEEDRRLMDALTGDTSLHSSVSKDRTYLEALLIFLLDTAARHGEAKKVERRDIDLINDVIVLRATITKTATKRIIPILTPRLKQSLEQRMALISDNPNEVVFGNVCVKNSFASACRRANITDFRIHDARHTAITRWIAAGIPAPEAMKYSGHTNWKTFMKYLNPTKVSHRRNAELLTVFNKTHEISDAMEASEGVN